MGYSGFACRFAFDRGIDKNLHSVYMKAKSKKANLVSWPDRSIFFGGL